MTDINIEAGFKDWAKSHGYEVTTRPDHNDVPQYLSSSTRMVEEAWLAAKRASVGSVGAVEDAKRFYWWFSDTDKGDFLMEYMHGMRKGYSVEEWRIAIDKAIAAKEPT